MLMQKGSEDLLAYVNDFIEEEKDSGRIDELADEYIYRYIGEEKKDVGKDNEKIINFEDKRKSRGERNCDGKWHKHKHKHKHKHRDMDPKYKYWDKDSDAMTLPRFAPHQ